MSHLYCCSNAPHITSVSCTQTTISNNRIWCTITAGRKMQQNSIKRSDDTIFVARQKMTGRAPFTWVLGELPPLLSYCRYGRIGRAEVTRTDWCMPASFTPHSLLWFDFRLLSAGLHAPSSGKRFSFMLITLCTPGWFDAGSLSYGFWSQFCCDVVYAVDLPPAMNSQHELNIVLPLLPLRKWNFRFKCD